MMNYVSRRAVFDDATTLCVTRESVRQRWVNHHAWRKTICQICSHDHEPHASYGGPMHKAEPVRVQQARAFIRKSDPSTEDLPQYHRTATATSRHQPACRAPADVRGSTS